MSNWTVFDYQRDFIHCWTWSINLTKILIVTKERRLYEQEINAIHPWSGLKEIVKSFLLQFWSKSVKVEVENFTLIIIVVIPISHSLVECNGYAIMQGNKIEWDIYFSFYFFLDDTSISMLCHFLKIRVRLRQLSLCCVIKRSSRRMEISVRIKCNQN
jgi:hypothetical protein